MFTATVWKVAIPIILDRVMIKTGRILFPLFLVQCERDTVFFCGLVCVEINQDLEGCVSYASTLHIWVKH